MKSHFLLTSGLLILAACSARPERLVVICTTLPEWPASMQRAAVKEELLLPKEKVTAIHESLKIFIRQRDALRECWKQAGF